MKRDGLAIALERRGISSGTALRHLSRPGSLWGDCPQRRRSQGSDSQDHQD